jgi:hypothetical protein
MKDLKKNKIIILCLALFIISINCKKHIENTIETATIINQLNTLVPFEKKGDDFIFKDYTLKSNRTNNTFEILYKGKLIGKINFDNAIYEGPGFLAYISELDNGIKNILIEATADVGTAWYYSVIIENSAIVNQFFIKDPRTDSEKYSLDKFISISINNDSIEYKFDKKMVSKYSTVPNDAIINGDYIYITKEIKSKKLNVLELFLLEAKNNNKYTLIFDKSHDLNLDGIDDKIFVQKNNLEFSSDNDETKTSIITLFISNGNSFKKYINTTIFPNNSNDQFETIDFNKNYFSIKLFNEVPNEYFIQKYITFKFNENLIKLNKFSKTINDKQTNVDISKMKEVLFENYNSNNDKFK